jgi:hypothetical protein
MSDYRRGFGLDIGFIDHLYTQPGTTSNYRATANLHNSQNTTAPDKPFPACCVFNTRSLVKILQPPRSSPLFTASLTELTWLAELSSFNS